MAIVAVGLLTIVVVVVAANTASPAGWELENRRVRRTGQTYRETAEQLRPIDRLRYFDPEDPIYKEPLKKDASPKWLEVPTYEVPSLLDPTRDSFQRLILSIPHVAFMPEDDLTKKRFLHDWAMMNFTRWVILGSYVGFILPLFTLAYASGAFGTERESRSLVWLMTRPIPRSAIYLAEFLGTLPWCLAFGFGGFLALCLAGGQHGRTAMGLYWPAAIAGTVALSALFHLVGAVFRRPVVVGLVYVFFYEALVSTLPGSMKLASLTFYVRSLMYNEAVAAGYQTGVLEVSQPVSSLTAWCVLSAATLGLSLLGMWLFARSDYRDDV
jgi:ABC-type transport system involved in multi-copper enzyme maturation permease subunit